MSQNYSENDPFDQGSQLNMNIEFSKMSLDYLKETAKWGKFMAIVGFVLLGLFVLMAFFMGSIFSSIPGGSAGLPFAGGFITVFYLLIAALYFFPTLYLYRFSTQAKAAIDNYDTNTMTEALGNLKSLFKFMGILTAIMVGLYALGFLFGIAGGAFAAFM